MHLMENMQKPAPPPAATGEQPASSREGIISQIDETVSRLGKMQYPPGCSFQHRQQSEESDNNKPG
jgi:hypothetical protein